MQYLSAREAGRILYTPEYLRQLANADKIDYIRTKGGQRRYNVQAFIEGKSESTFTTVCYCRVSSVKQRDDLERQVAYMRSIYPKTEIIRDIGSEQKGLKPYWTDFTKAINSKLRLPIGIDSPDSALKSYNTLSSKTVENSWFSTIKVIAPKRNSQLICSPSSTSSVVECMDSESIVTKSKKIRIYPNRNQRLILRQWLGCARYIYNRAVEYLQQPDTQANWKAIKTDILHSLPDWAKAVPYQIKSVAI